MPGGAGSAATMEAAARDTAPRRGSIVAEWFLKERSVDEYHKRKVKRMIDDR
jgi:hypothetical protein